jgi:hypothetical protein
MIMERTDLPDLQMCIANQLVVGLQIRSIPWILLVCIESVDEYAIVVKEKDISGFAIPFNRKISFSDILTLKITDIRFDHPHLAALRGSYS